MNLRSPLAQACDEWMGSDEGRHCLEGYAFAQYLRHRLEVAFVAGWEAAIIEHTDQDPQT